MNLSSWLVVGCNTSASTLQLFWTEKWEINLKQPPDKLSRSKRSVPSGPCMNHGDEFMGWVSSLNFPIYFPQQLMLKRKQKTSSIAQANLHSLYPINLCSLFTTPMGTGCARGISRRDAAWAPRQPSSEVLSDFSLGSSWSFMTPIIAAGCHHGPSAVTRGEAVSWDSYERGPD